MAKRKIQVTLDEVRYQELARIAQRDGKKMAAVVRESIVRYCLGPEAQKAKRDALDELFALEDPVPREYGDWKQDYSRLKSRCDQEDEAPAHEGESSEDERRE